MSSIACPLVCCKQWVVLTPSSPFPAPSACFLQALCFLWSFNLCSFLQDCLAKPVCWQFILPLLSESDFVKDGTAGCRGVLGSWFLSFPSRCFPLTSSFNCFWWETGYHWHHCFPISKCLFPLAASEEIFSVYPQIFNMMCWGYRGCIYSVWGLWSWICGLMWF